MQAEVAATVANGGARMQPYLVSGLLAPDLSALGDPTQPKKLDRAMSSTTADTLTQLMIGAESHAGSGGARTLATCAGASPAPSDRQCLCGA